MSAPMLSYDEMIARMLRAVGPDGDGLGRYAANVAGSAIRAMDRQSKTLLRPCLPHLARAVEVACPARLEPGEILIVAASRQLAHVVTLNRLPDHVHDIADIPPVSVWHIVAAAIDSGLVEIIADAVMAQMGLVAVRDVFALAAEMQKTRAPIGVALVCLAGSEGTEADGALLTVPVPVMTALNEAA